MTTDANFSLTDDQQAALNAVNLFISDPVEQVFVLSGYSGTGKSTLIKHLIDQLPAFMKTLKLINPSFKELEMQLTATTNKAAEAFSWITGMDVSTIHSFLSLRVMKDFKNNTSKLVPKNSERKSGYLLFIDEASYVDRNLLTLIFQGIENCKVIFIGDKAQLTPVMSSETPVFSANFPGAHLSEVVRQAKDNPIITLATLFRNTVSTGEFFNFTPDGNVIQHMDRKDFNLTIAAEFGRPEWRYQDSKMLGWTNKTVIYYNQAISNHVTGDPHFQVGDYAVCNSFLSIASKSIKTDQLVCITGISEDRVEHDVVGNYYTLDHQINTFVPKTLQAKKDRLKIARDNNHIHIVATIENTWADLRNAYACTINKAQGSTFDRVFIDLDDIRKCNSGDQIARMMYVAVSRARYQVFLTGDLA